MHEKDKPSTEQVMVALQKLVPPGSSHNPIVVLEDSPPPKVRPQTRDYKRVEPHRFQSRHSKLYTYKPSRPALVPKTANGNTFTGHQSHDIYRMHTAKMATPAWEPIGQQGISFEMQYPMSAQYLTPRPNASYCPPQPHVQHYTHNTPTYPQSMTIPLPTEEQIRKKALQYVREHSRLSPRKRKIAEDPDETSDSESEEIDLEVTLSPDDRVQVLPKGSSYDVLPNPSFQLTTLIEHASLLTSFLRVYPQSADQRGLREDIAMLASVQNQQLADWLNFEVQQSQDEKTMHTPRLTISSDEPTNLPARLTDQGQAEAEKRKTQDEEIRALLSADAKLWQDGSGLGVADVYAAVPAVEEETDESRGKIVVSASDPVPCTVEAPSSASKITETASSPVRRFRPEGNSTTSPKAGRTVSSPVVRASGMRKLVPVRFGTE